jgi:hypothetical protein
VAELHSLWADVGTVSENVEVALPQLQTVCDTVGQAVSALQAQDDRRCWWLIRDTVCLVRDVGCVAGQCSGAVGFPPSPAAESGG